MPARNLRFVRCLPIAVLLILLSCGDDSTAPAPEPEPGPVDRDGANEVSGTIGPDGGTITTTGSDGVQYTLEVPGGALMEPTRITVAPVLGIDGLGLSGGLAGAVDLKPAGLRFARPALLRIATTATAGGGERLAGFTASGDFSRRELILSASDDGEIAVLVPHFSVAGAGFGTEEDVSAFSTPSTDPITTLTLALQLLPVPWDNESRQAAEQFAQQGFVDVVLPGIEGADTDAALVDAIASYHGWRYLLAVIGFDGQPPIEGLFGGGTSLGVPAGFSGLVVQALDAAAVAIKDAIDGNNLVCESEQSLTALGNVLFWHEQAVFLGIDTPENGLDFDTIRQTLCAEVVIEGLVLPANLQVGFPHSLDVNCGLLFGGGGATFPAPFQVSVSAVGATVQDPAGFTSSQGTFVTVITATDSEVSVTVTACLVRPGTVQPSDLCASVSDEAGEAINLDGTYLGSKGGIRYSTLTVTQNQNAVSGTFELRSPAEHHTGSFTATLAGLELIGIDIELDGCEFTGTPGGTVRVVNGKTYIDIQPNGTDCHGHDVDNIFGCGPNSSLNNIDLAGTWQGHVALNVQQMFFPVTMQLSGGIGAITGTFTGERSGTFSATIVNDPNPGGCVFAKLTNISMTFTGGCELTPSGLPLNDGCVEFEGGILRLTLSTNASWRDTCTGRELLGFSFSREMDGCTGE